MAVNSLNTLYGVLIALSEFGAGCTRMLVFPRLPVICRRLTRMTSAGAQAADAPTAAVLLDKEGGFHQTVTSSATAPLSHAEMRSLESLKTLMSVSVFVNLAMCL